MHVLKVVLVLELLLEVLLHHGEGGVRGAAGELLVVQQLSLGLEELVTVLAAVLALLCNTQGGDRDTTSACTHPQSPPHHSWMMVWLTDCSSIKKKKEKNLKRKRDS